MFHPQPSMLELGGDELLEYEDIKKTWEKKIIEKSNRKPDPVAEAVERRNEVHERIGLRPSNQQRK